MLNVTLHVHEVLVLHTVTLGCLVTSVCSLLGVLIFFFSANILWMCLLILHSFKDLTETKVNIGLWSCSDQVCLF